MWVFSILQGQHIQSWDKTSCVCSDMVGAVCSSSFSCVSLATCILATKQAYFSWSTNRSGQDLQPIPLLQTEWISWSKSLVTTELLQNVDFCGLWTGDPVTGNSINCCGLGGVWAVVTVDSNPPQLFAEWLVYFFGYFYMFLPSWGGLLAKPHPLKTRRRVTTRFLINIKYTYWNSNV